MPVLIFGAGAVEASVIGTTAAPHLYLLGAFAIVSLLFAPWAAAAALRISLE
jgi:heme exporter protein B